MEYNYFASHRGSPRARAFQKKYGESPPGEVFWFENQPYAGRPIPASNIPNPPMAPGYGVQDFHSQPGSPPRFPAGNIGPTPAGYNYGMQRPGADVTGRYGKSGGEGLLSNQSSPKGSLLYDVDTSDKSGWEKSERYNEAMAEMLLQWGLDQSKGEQWDDWG
jgi:hypothetical protein